MDKITYATKSDINENPSVPASNKVQAVDMNEIKMVVNNNADATHVWKTLGNTTGSTALAISGTVNELLAVVKINNNDNVCLNIVIPFNILTTTSKGFNSGYVNNGLGVSSGCRVLASTTSINLSVAYLNGNDNLSSSTMMVYYR